MACGAGKLDLEIIRGITFGPIAFKIYDASGVMDLTGYSVFAEIKATVGATAIIQDLSPTHDSSGGTVTISLTDIETQALAATTEAGWDLILENASGERSGPYLAGTVGIVSTYTTHA